MGATLKAWHALDDQTRKDLIAWYNVSGIEIADCKRLTELYSRGQFEAWNCPECGERVYRGTPDDWGDFQGVRQADYTSYPGNAEKYTPEYLEKMCDACRAASFQTCD